MPVESVVHHPALHVGHVKVHHLAQTARGTLPVPW